MESKGILKKDTPISAQTMKGPPVLTKILDPYRDATIDLNPLYNTSTVHVYKVHTAEGEFVLKALDIPSDRPEKLLQLKKEYEYGKNLGTKCIHFVSGISISTCEMDSQTTRVEILMRYAGRSLIELMCTATPKEVKMWIVQSLTAFQFLEGMRMSHLDIKPQNMVYHGELLTVIDMGVSLDYEARASVFEPVGAKAEEIRGFTRLYGPPEVLRDVSSGEKQRIQEWIGNSVDVYCWGMSFYQIITKMDSGRLKKLRSTHSTDDAAQYKRFVDVVLKTKELSELDPTNSIQGAIISCLQYDPKERPTFSRIRKLLSEIESVEGYGSNLASATIHNFMAIAHAKHVGDYKEALGYAEKSLHIFEVELGKHNENTANAYQTVGNVHDKFGNHKSALENYTKALDILKKAGEGPNVANLYNNIGIAYSELDNPSAALENHMKALVIRRNLFGENNLDTANSYDGIGISQRGLGDYKNALENHMKALEIRRKLFDENNLDTANSYDGIWIVHKELGDYKDALENYMRAMEIRRKLLDENPPGSASTYSNIGNVYECMSDYGTALENHTKALKIRMKLLGEDHADTAASYRDIGQVYHSMGNYKAALENYEKSLVVRKKVLGEDHLDTAVSYTNIGIVQADLGNHKIALENHTKALNIRIKALGETHLDIAASYTNVGITNGDLRDYKAALRNFANALNIQKRLLGENHLDTAGTYGNLGSAYYKMCDYKGALENYTAAWNIQRKILGETHPDTVQSYECVFSVQGILKMGKGEDQPNVALRFYICGLCCERADNYFAALYNYQLALATWESIGNVSHKCAQDAKDRILKLRSAIDFS
eukprot:TRINITY_DN1037_c0_g1_i1.p1 TRINITY_DN1037_c0_g1~~TRINITY_DN1037_c0_g1_i1.p1  ORF type:complete len:833 (-),score=81.63 TRINITY_DN1037_c0_g1_i1:198-2696(-)